MRLNSVMGRVWIGEQFVDLEGEAASEARVMNESCADLFAVVVQRLA